MTRNFLTVFMLLFFAANFAQNCDWQQRVDYQMEIDVNEKDFTYTGKMKVVYQNQSPETLNKIYFHLYYNAFQPGSAMDYRLRNIDRKSTRLNSSHVKISYAVFCLKKKRKKKI